MKPTEAFIKEIDDLQRQWLQDDVSYYKAQAEFWRGECYKLLRGE